MECNYNYNDFCTNDQCPARGDYCPVPDTEGICQYEEREDAAYVLTSKGCLLLALMHHDIELDELTFDSIWDEFAMLMIQFGYTEEE